MQLAFSKKLRFLTPLRAPPWALPPTACPPPPPPPPPPRPPATPREWGEGLAKGRRGAFLPVGRNASDFPKQRAIFELGGGAGW